MALTVEAEVLIPGTAEGHVLCLDAPISFWGGVDPASSAITLASHPQCGETIADRVIVIPTLIGSSSSSAVMLELLHAGKAPRALILGGRDAILPIGVVVARQMGWPVIPVLVVSEPPFRTGDHVALTQDGRVSWTSGGSTPSPR